MRKRRVSRDILTKADASLAQAPTDVRVLFRKFVNIKIAEGIAQGTIAQYEQNFRLFCDYLELKNVNYDVSKITADFLREWLTYMQYEHIQFSNDDSRIVKTVGLKPSTINTRLKTIRVMFNTLHRHNLIKFNPVASVKNVSEPEELIDTLSDKEILRLLGVMDTTFYTTFRDYVLTMLLLDTMLRISEATRLLRTDIDRDSNLVIIRANVAKNRKARAVPISRKVLLLVNELIEENDKGFYSDYIFATSEDTPYDRNNYNQRLKTYAELAAIDKPVYPHLLRHTAATRWLENGGGMEELRLILGHSKYDMVKRYAHVSKISVVKAAAKFSLTNHLDL